MTTRVRRKMMTGIALAVATAALAAPGAFAGRGNVTVPSELQTIQQPGGVYDVNARPVTIPAWMSEIRYPGSVSDADAMGFRQPGGVTDAAIASPTTTPLAAGFEWRYVAVGIGGATGLGLIALALVLAARRHREPYLT